jgi:excisionase family DNA binding protein
MSKITAEHLARAAYVYVRQSTPEQVRNNHESRRRQYALADHARQLGWSEVVVIDDDLGRSGGGTARPGFERLLGAVCEGRVGCVMSTEISRLARNGREWHTLMEFCAVVNTLLADEHGIYDPRLMDDRFMLGMKGNIAEMEVSMFRERSRAAINMKASRGELHTRLAIGYVRGPDDGIDKDPDARVRETIDLLFRKYSELGSARQLLLWCRHESITVPSHCYGPQGCAIVWKTPGYTTLHNLLTNPVYGGAYVFGRHKREVKLDAGRKRIVRRTAREQQHWLVLIRDHHESYISWDTYESNQRTLTDNANMYGERVRGSIRRGEALLSGLLRCRHCGGKLHAEYGGHTGIIGRYQCRGELGMQGDGRCLKFGALRVDQAVCAEVLRTLQPVGVEAALRAIETRVADADDASRQVELALEQARYEAALARRQYDAVDPANRLVASELERRWNERLTVVAGLDDRLAALRRNSPPPIGEQERARLLSLGADLERAWNHPAASPEIRKRILRAVLKEIVVSVDGPQVQMVLHWQGGDHTPLVVRKNRTGEHRFVTDTETTELIIALARLLPDASIAALFNRMGRRTAKDHTWTAARVRVFRNDHGVAVYRDGERSERGEVNLEEAAAVLNVSRMTVLRLIQRQILAAQQPCPGAPWSIRRTDLDSPAVQGAAAGLNVPLTADANQSNLEFQ